MRKFIAFLLPLLSLFFCQAQKLSYNQFEMLRIANSQGSSLMTFNNQYDDVAGNAFLFESWKNGQAISNYNGNTSKLNMKVDLYKNKVFINVRDTVYDVTEAIIYNTFILFPREGDTLEKILLVYEPKITGPNNNFVQVLNAGKPRLIKRQYKEIKEVQTGAYSAKEKQFADFTTYYILDQKDVPVEVKLNKKSMEKLFTPEEWQQLQGFTRQKGLSLNKEEDWVTLLNYYQTIGKK